MRLILGGLMLAVSAAVMAQNQGSARFVAEKSNSVTWSQDGTFLGYDFHETGGHISSIGLYDLVHSRGKTLISPSWEESFSDPIWLAGGEDQLTWSSEKTTISRKKTDRLALWILDGKKLSAKKVWSCDFPEDQGARLTIQPSPSLTHAIVTVSSVNQKSYLVLTQGAQDVVVSQDISTAIQQGHGFAGWTIDGTAFFGGGSSDDLSSDAGHGNAALLGQFFPNGSDQGGKAVKYALTNLIEVRIRLFTAHSNPAIPPGNEGLELMPTNGYIRPVRFRGYWQSSTQNPSPTALFSQDHPLDFRESKADTRGLWLTPNQKEPKSGVLVSPTSESSWLHPDGRTVAFTVNGVLFVKVVPPREK